MSLKHAYITANCRWKYFPGLSTGDYSLALEESKDQIMSTTVFHSLWRNLRIFNVHFLATFYKLRQMFRESMMSSSDTSDEDSSPAISTPGKV